MQDDAQSWPSARNEFYDLLLGLTPGAPVPKEVPKKFTVTKLERDKVPNLGKNPYNLNAEEYTEKSQEFQKHKERYRTGYVIQDEKGNVAGVVWKASNGYVINITVGSEVKLEWHDKQLVVEQPDVRNGENPRSIPLSEKPNEVTIINLIGPTGGKPAKLSDQRNPGPNVAVGQVSVQGKFDAVVKEDSRIYFSVIASSSGQEGADPTILNIHTPIETISKAEVLHHVPPKVNANVLDPDSNKSEIKFGRNKIEVRNRPSEVAPDINPYIDISFVTKTSQGIGTIEIVKGGVPVGDEKAMEKTLKDVTKKPQPKEQGMGPKP